MCLQHLYWLHQLRHVRRSLDYESAATHVYAFVTSRVDQCNVVFARAMKSVTDTLQHVMNAAVRVVSETRKFDHCLTQILHDDLHWLDVADRVTYKSSSWCHHAQMSAWQGYTVLCRLLHTGHRCCWQTVSQVSHAATDGGATTSAIHCWPPSIHCARPHGLELLAG